MGELVAGAASAREWALVALLIMIGVLFVVTLAFSTLAVAVRVRHRVRERRWAALTERWRDAVLRAVADPSTASSVHDLVRDGEELYFVGFVLEYTRRVRGEERQSLRELARPYLDRVGERADARRSEIRARAIQTLGTLGLPEHEDRVVAALDDPSPLVAMVAARALAREETPRYAEAVLARLSRFSGWNRRFLAAMLAAIGPDVTEALRDGLADDDAEPWVRAVLADALRLQGDFLAGDVAARVVATTDDVELLTAALRLLAAVGGPDHVDVVRPHVEAEELAVRVQALRALGTVGGEDDVGLLLGALDDPSPWAALYAARGVRDAGGRGALREVAVSPRARARLAAQVLAEDPSG